MHTDYLCVKFTVLREYSEVRESDLLVLYTFYVMLYVKLCDPFAN